MKYKDHSTYCNWKLTVERDVALFSRRCQRFTSIASVCESGIVINGVYGNPTKVHGEITLPCKYGTMLRNITFKILDTPKLIVLLGRSDCLRFSLIMRVNTVNSVSISTKELI